LASWDLYKARNPWKNFSPHPSFDTAIYLPRNLDSRMSTASDSEKIAQDFKSSQSQESDRPLSLTEEKYVQHNHENDFVPDEEKLSQVAALAEEMGINQKRLMWKIDLWVVPPLLILYFLSFLDRVNISNAKVYNMESDLGLTGHQFNTALTVFFVPYVVFEIFSNYFLKMFKPHVWLTGCIVLFGAVSLGLGFVTNFAGLVACRVLLGLFECGTFPGIFYILGTYYTAPESQRRYSFFFSSTTLAGAAGSAIAFKIHDLDGVHGIESWRWIFIIEGAATIGMGIFVLYWTIPDFPETARFLNDNERLFLKRKLEIYSISSAYDFKFSLKDSFVALKDPVMAYTALAYFGLIIPSYGYAYFAPTIIKQMNYSAQSANQHSVYPWLVAFGYSNIAAFFSDRLKNRSAFAVSSALFAIIGLSMILGLPNNPQGRYAGCFLTAMGLYSSMPALVCWTNMNFGGHLRKSTGSAFQIGFGNIGGIIATFIFLPQDSPRFVKGLSIAIAATVFAIGFMCVMLFHYARLNKKRQSITYREKFYNQTERDIVLQGDLHPNFRYLY
jgi:MFS family permease